MAAASIEPPCQGHVDHRLETGEERRRILEVQCRASTDAHQPNLDQVQQPTAQCRVEVRQVAHRHERHRVQRRGDPLKPATLSVGAQARRIDSRCGDRVAQLLDEAVSALDLLTDLVVGHLGIGHHASSSSGGSPR
jgi:hypothetical protein